MNDDTPRCPSCESTNIVSQMEPEKFAYGVNENPVTLEAQVLVFHCMECKDSYTGEQAEAARADAVKRYQLSVFPLMVAALKAQHEAIDILFALLIAKTMRNEKPFYPTESGKPWQALLAGKAAVEAAGGSLE